MVARTVSPPRTLYQFPLSLYCEKTRWNLDHKRLDYRCRDLVPGLHLPLARWRAGISTLPILREHSPENRRTVGDSTDIALWLERTYPHHPLLPENGVQRERVLAHEAYFDELGDHVRRCVWSLAVDGPALERIFYGFTGYSALSRWIGRNTLPVLRRMLRWRFRLQPTRVVDSWARVTAALDHVEQLLDNRDDAYLVDGRFTLADLTAATMLAPLIGPEGSPWSDRRLGIEPTPERRELRHRVVGRWVTNMYARHRSARPA